MKKTWFPALAALLLAMPFSHAADTAPIVNEPQQQFDITPAPARTEPPQPVLPEPDKTAPALSSSELEQRPELLYQALTSSVILNNTAAIRELLPLYRNLPEEKKAADLLIVPAAEAALARADGRYAEAAKQYRRVVELNPKISAMRFLLAQTLFENRKFEAAETEFQQLKSATDLSDGIRQAVDVYLNALKQRQKWQFNGGASYIQDSNLNNVAEGASLERGSGRWYAPKQESGHGFSYNASAQRDWQAGLPFEIRSEVEADGRIYWDNHAYDEHSVRLTLGGVSQNAVSQTAVLPFYQYRWYGGESYSREAGVRLEYSRQLSSRNRLLTAAEASRNQYPDRPWLKGSSHTLSASWLFVQNPQRYWIFGSDYARRTARDDSSAYRRYGIRAGLTQNWNNGLGISLNAGAARRLYDAPDLFDIRRDDKEYNAGLSLWQKKWQIGGITPRLVVQWHKTDSNNPLYSYRKSNAFIELNKSF